MKETNTISKVRKTKSILLFDGLCNLCDSSVQFVMKRDSKRQFLFTSLQSVAATAFLKAQPETIQNSDSIILVTSDGVYSKSTAALKIAIKLKGLWFLMGIFFILPAFIRDAIYDFIAKKRYQWFGKSDRCRIPTPEEQNLFID